MRIGVVGPTMSVRLAPNGDTRHQLPYGETHMLHVALLAAVVAPSNSPTATADGGIAAEKLAKQSNRRRQGP
jgi:hypothetical protein